MGKKPKDNAPFSAHPFLIHPPGRNEGETDKTYLPDSNPVPARHRELGRNEGKKFFTAVKISSSIPNSGEKQPGEKRKKRISPPQTQSQ